MIYHLPIRSNLKMYIIFSLILCSCYHFCLTGDLSTILPLKKKVIDVNFGRFVNLEKHACIWDIMLRCDVLVNF